MPCKRAATACGVPTASATRRRFTEALSQARLAALPLPEFRAGRPLCLRRPWGSVEPSPLLRASAATLAARLQKGCQRALPEEDLKGLPGGCQRDSERAARG